MKSFATLATLAAAAALALVPAPSAAAVSSDGSAAGAAAHKRAAAHMRRQDQEVPPCYQLEGSVITPHPRSNVQVNVFHSPKMDITFCGAKRDEMSTSANAYLIRGDKGDIFQGGILLKKGLKKASSTKLAPFGMAAYQDSVEVPNGIHAGNYTLAVQELDTTQRESIALNQNIYYSPMSITLG